MAPLYIPNIQYYKVLNILAHNLEYNLDVIIYEDGVEAIYMTNGEIVLKDYYNVFESDLS